MADADGSAAGSPDPTQHSTKPDLGSKVGNSDSQAPESVFSITICREMKIFTLKQMFIMTAWGPSQELEETILFLVFVNISSFLYLRKFHFSQEILLYFNYFVDNLKVLLRSSEKQ